MFQQLSEKTSPMLSSWLLDKESDREKAFFFDDNLEGNDQVRFSPDYSQIMDSTFSIDTNLLSDLSDLSELIQENEEPINSIEIDAKTSSNVLSKGSVSVVPEDGLYKKETEPKTLAIKELSQCELLRKQEVPENEVSKNLNKAAIQAKVNREKKKKYIKELEEETNRLRKENSILRSKEKKSEKSINIMEKEILYLRSVLENDSQLANIISNLNQPVRLTNSFEVSKRVIEEDHDYGVSAKRRRVTKANGGVCLHVQSGDISLELCSRCSELSNIS